MANPILVNDLRKSVFRRKPVRAVALAAVGILLLTFIAESTAGLQIISSLHGFPIWSLPDLLLPFVVPAFAAGSFAKEHEQRTWDDVLLTNLGAWEIIRGKFIACLLPTVITITVAFPAFYMLLIVQDVHWAIGPASWIPAYLIRWLISAVLYISIVMVCSYYGRSGRTTLAVSYVIIGGYALVSGLVWLFLADALIPHDSGNMYPNYGYYTPYSSTYGDDFLTSGIDLAQVGYAIQATVVGAGCLVYLRALLGRRG